MSLLSNFGRYFPSRYVRQRNMTELSQLIVSFLGHFNYLRPHLERYYAKKMSILTTKVDFTKLAPPLVASLPMSLCINVPCIV